MSDCAFPLTYLAYDGEFYKIGKSIDPIKRMRDLKVANPRITLVTFGSAIDEKDLHAYFHKCRVSGEWFDLNKAEVVKCIQLIETGLQPNPDTQAHYQNQSGDYGKLALRKRKQWESMQYERYVIDFGKHTGRPLIEMTSTEDISYVTWFVNAYYEKHICGKSKSAKRRNAKDWKYKSFKWWLNNYERYRTLTITHKETEGIQE